MRGKEYNVEKELQEIVEKKRLKEEGGERSVIKTIFSKEFLLPFVKIGILMSLSQWAGINILSSYLVTVFEVQTRKALIYIQTPDNNGVLGIQIFCPFIDPLCKRKLDLASTHRWPQSWSPPSSFSSASSHPSYSG